MPQETYNDTMNQLFLRIRAGCPVIYLNSFEEGRVLDNIARLLREIRRESPGKHLWTFYEGIGLCQCGSPPVPPQNPPAAPLYPNQRHDWLDLPSLGNDTSNTQPGNVIEALKSLCNATMATYFQLGDSITVFFDLHPWLRKDRDDAVRPLRHAA